MKRISHFLYIFIFCVIIIFSVFPLLTIYGQGIMVKPMRLDIYCRQGDSIEKEIEITNMLAERAQTVYIEMMYLGETQNGRWAAIPKDSKMSKKLKTWSCLDWVKVDKKQLYIQPLGKDKVQVKIKVPLRVYGFHGMAIIVRSEPIRTGKANIAVVLRFLVPVLVEIQGRPLRQKIDLVDINMQFLEQSKENPATTLVSISIANKGETYSGLKGNIDVMYQSKEHWQRVAQADFSEVGIIPGVELNLKSDLKRCLPSGKYKLRGTLYVDGRQTNLLVKEIDFIGDPTITKVAADVPLILEPSILCIKAVPGGARTAGIKIQNLSEETVNVSVGVEVPKSLRGVSLGKLKGEDFACTGWIRVIPDNFTLTPGRHRNICIIAKLPKNEQIYANYYVTLNFRAEYTDGQSAGKNTSLIWLKNAKIKSEPAAQIMKIGLTAEEDPRYIIQAKCANIGNIHFSPTCKATVTKPDGTSMLETVLSGYRQVTLPLEIADFSGILDFSMIEEGIYRITLLMDYGEKGEQISKILPIQVSVEEGKKIVTTISVNEK